MMAVTWGLYNAILYSWLLCLLVGYGCLGCLEEERVGLLNLKVSINPPNGTALFSWGGDVDDCCAWESVVCDNKTNRVIQLDLSYTTVWGALGNWSLNASLLLPFQQLQILDLSDNHFDRFHNHLTGFQDLPRLKKLRVLDLSWNDLIIVPNLSSLPSLKVLDLSWNNLTIIPNLSALPSLEVLNLSNNHINSLQLQELKYVRRLEVLNLGNNNLMGGIPPIIGTLSNLKSLSLRGNSLNDSLSIEGLCKLSNLQELDISGNRIDGNLPLCFNNWTSLRTLDLSKNNFKGTIPSSLFSSLKLLEYISLSYNGFDGSLDFTSLYNNSKLVVFKLAGNKKNLKVETENSMRGLPSFQLRVLRLSNCILNRERRMMPSFLSNQYELRIVDLSNNGIVGDLPTWLLVNNSKLESIYLSGNQLRGPLDLGSKLAYLVVFDISSNLIHGEIPADLGTALPNLIVLNMSGNALHGNFPPSMVNMKSLQVLDLSSNNFSGLVPEHLVMAFFSLDVLKLSNNDFRGTLPAKWNLTNLRYLFLDDNHFSGEIPHGIMQSSSLESLDISNNLFSGQIPEWIGNFPELTSLVMSTNLLKGVMPRGFCKLQELRLLDLSGNKISMSIPPCVNLSSMRFLHLQNNSLNGPIPDVLSKAPSLVTLDLRDNKFSGAIPLWISSLSSLRVLLLRGNDLQDPIPKDLCQLRSIRIMDLSYNNLSESIPSCLNNLTFGGKGAQDHSFLTSEDSWFTVGALTTYSYESKLDIPLVLYLETDPSLLQERVEFTTKRRSELYTGRVLRFMSGMDLSRNNLIGPIPPELGDLREIHSINLSGNHLTGSIPGTFSNLEEIESLDLSHNMLMGPIPPQLIDLHYMSDFSVAYNNLSGRIPEPKGQFITFQEGSYEGNPLLCGFPLQQSCSSMVAGAQPVSDNGDNNESWETIFFYSFGGSLGVGFFGTIAFIFLNSYYRELLFGFIECHVPFLRLRGY